mmetsp:Transcript_2984/g.10463  ORF Transcript_2984/g.10463 Transcript_2984/m.10463 type:complete len:296 (-) Transcript_2984:69-956(-)
MSLVVRCGVTVAVALAVAAGGLKKKALSPDGAAAGVAVALCCGMAGGYRALALLGAFFVSSSALTRFKSGDKKKLEHGHKKGGQRTATQVFSNALAGCLCSLLYCCAAGTEELWVDLSAAPLASLCALGVLGHFACTNGDTWASELGTVLAAGPPLLLLGLRSDGRPIVCQRVPTGTNGGVSLAGTAASAAAGLLIGATFALVSLLSCSTGPGLSCLSLCLLGTLGGILGSLVDSVLGGTLQYSGWDEKLKMVVNEPTPSAVHVTGVGLLDNHQVNNLSSILTAIALPCISLALR